MAKVLHTMKRRWIGSSSHIVCKVCNRDFLLMDLLLSFVNCEEYVIKSSAGIKYSYIMD
jgi:hypothetical protein